MPDVFVSYNREDLEVAQRVVEGLGKEDIAVWLDTDLRAGENYDEVTEQRLRDAKAVVVLWSSRSVKSRWVRAEATLGSRKNTLVPAMIEACDRPIMFELIQTADLSNWKGDRTDPQWRSFIADVRRVIATNTPAAGAAETPGKKSKKQAASQSARKGGGLAGALITLLLIGGLGAAGYYAWRIYGPSVLNAGAGADKSEQTAPAAVVPLAAAANTFRDCDACPEMVAITAGIFSMGSPADELGRNVWEGPQRRVAIAPFALSSTEITFDQWDACVADGGCNGYQPTDRGWGRGARPVIHVSWRDARAYAEWLSRETGRSYRLPSEAEWEYAARAGSTTPFWWGALYDAGRAGVGPMPQSVEHLQANPFGLRGMTGNAREWVQDCYVNTFENAPLDGRSLEASGCALRVVRGGAYSDSVESLRIASRSRNPPEQRDRQTGFRVAAAQ